MSAKVITVDFRARAKPVVVQEVPAKLVTLHRQASYAQQREAYDLYVAASSIDEDPAKYSEAARIYRQAIALDPNLVVAYTNLGNILFRQRFVQEARDMYDAALQIDPGQPEANYNLGYLALEDGEYATAIDFFGRALKTDPRFADAHYNLAMALEHIPRRAEAVRHWVAYVALEPTGLWADTARQYIGTPKETKRQQARRVSDELQAGMRARRAVREAANSEPARTPPAPATSPAVRNGYVREHLDGIDEWLSRKGPKS